MELSKIKLVLSEEVRNDKSVFDLKLIKKILNINLKQYNKTNCISGLIDANIFIRDYIDEEHINFIEEVYIDDVIYPL